MASLGLESIGILVPRLYGKDGESIALGQTRYGEDGKRFTITGLGTHYVWGREEGSKIDKRLKPDWLTSKRPDSGQSDGYDDSWEQLEEDARLSGVEYCKKYIHKRECDQIKGLDLIERAKTLAGVE